MVLASGGVFGVTSYLLSLRRHETGVRLALGASPGDILRSTVAKALSPVSHGIAVGIGVALVGLRLVQTRLHGLDLGGLPEAGLVALGVLGIAFLAALYPALEAAGTDPAVPLRSE